MPRTASQTSQWNYTPVEVVVQDYEDRILLLVSVGPSFRVANLIQVDPPRDAVPTPAVPGSRWPAVSPASDVHFIFGAADEDHALVLQLFASQLGAIAFAKDDSRPVLVALCLPPRLSDYAGLHNVVMDAADAVISREYAGGDR